MIVEDSFVTIPEMSLKTGVATRIIKRDIEDLQQRGILIYLNEGAVQSKTKLKAFRLAQAAERANILSLIIG